MSTEKTEHIIKWHPWSGVCGEWPKCPVSKEQDEVDAANSAAQRTYEKKFRSPGWMRSGRHG